MQVADLFLGFCFVFLLHEANFTPVTQTTTYDEIIDFIYSDSGIVGRALMYRRCADRNTGAKRQCSEQSESEWQFIRSG